MLTALAQQTAMAHEGARTIDIASPIAPAWLVLSVACVALVVIATHWVSMGRAAMPEPRRRIRSACGLVMMLSVPIFAYATGIASPASPRRFILAWMLASSMLLIVIVLACMDLCYTAILARRERLALVAHLREVRSVRTMSTRADGP